MTAKILDHGDKRWSNIPAPFNIRAHLSDYMAWSMEQGGGSTAETDVGVVVTHMT